MNSAASHGQVYICPMHSDMRQQNPGKCPICGMDLVPEGTRFVLLRHMMSSRSQLIMMLVLMAAIMAAVMMIR